MDNSKPTVKDAFDAIVELEEAFDNLCPVIKGYTPPTQIYDPDFKVGDEVMVGVSTDKRTIVSKQSGGEYLLDNGNVSMGYNLQHHVPEENKVVNNWDKVCEDLWDKYILD